MMLVVLAFLLSVVVTGDCTFARHGGRGTKYEDLDEFGLFRYNNGDSDEHQCLAYDSDMALSAELKAGRAFGTLASLFAGTSMLIFVSYFLFLERGKRISWITARTLAILALISQALTFVVFGEPLCTESGSYQCVLGPAGILAVFNVVLLFVIVGLSCNTAPFPNPLFKVTLYKNSDASEREEPSDTHMIDEGLNEA